MKTSSIRVLYGDLDAASLDEALGAGQVGCDIETSGLKWDKDEISTFQVSVPGRVFVVRVSKKSPSPRLAELVSSEAVVKIFHHAPFDLRFIVHNWGISPRSVACTKIASKITEPGLDPSEYSLKPLLARHLGIVIDKTEQRSDWTAADLTRSQLRYAATDVRFLAELLSEIDAKAAQRGVRSLILDSFNYLPTRVTLDLQGSGDVYHY